MLGALTKHEKACKVLKRCYFLLGGNAEPSTTDPYNASLWVLTQPVDNATATANN